MPFIAWKESTDALGRCCGDALSRRQKITLRTREKSAQTESYDSKCWGSAKIKVYLVPMRTPRNACAFPSWRWWKNDQDRRLSILTHTLRHRIQKIHDGSGKSLHLCSRIHLGGVHERYGNVVTVQHGVADCETRADSMHRWERSTYSSHLQLVSVGPLVEWRLVYKQGEQRGSQGWLGCHTGMFQNLGEEHVENGNLGELFAFRQLFLSGCWHAARKFPKGDALLHLLALWDTGDVISYGVGGENGLEVLSAVH